jgi:hypothetical protein
VGGCLEESQLPKIAGTVGKHSTFSILKWGARKLTGEGGDLKLVWAKFSTIRWDVLKMCMNRIYVDTQQKFVQA